MDSLIAVAARALAAGDPIGALKRVALRSDPPALALRGIDYEGGFYRVSFLDDQVFITHRASLLILVEYSS